MNKFDRNPSIYVSWLGWSVCFFVLSGVLRLLTFHLSQYSALIGDERLYIYMAQRLMDGRGYGYLHMPGWPWLISWVLRYWDSIMAIRYLIICLGALNSALVYLIARQVFGHKVGLISGFLHVFYPEHVLSSHLLYSEIAIESVIALLTLLSFFCLRSIKKWPILLLVSFLFGLGMLFKHFIIVAYVAFIIALLIYKKIEIARAFVSVIVFLVPIVMFSARHSAKGGDPFFIMGSPLKSMNEWKLNRIAGGIGGDSKLERADQFLSEKLVRGPHYLWGRTKDNLKRTWGLHSYPVDRFQRRSYGWRLSPRIGMLITKAYYALLLSLGLIGLFLMKPSVFKLYAGVTFLALCSMCVFFLMMPRYKLPFMFLICISAATAFVPSCRRIFHDKSTLFGRISFSVFMGLFLWTVFI